MSELIRQDAVFLLQFDSEENRFSGSLLEQIDRTLSAVEELALGAHPEPVALVTTGTGKFFSNGLDLDWLMANKDKAASNVAQVHSVFARMLRLPCVSVAAINGHAFAGGAMLALSHDFRIMRADRGYFCVPEVDLGLPFTDGMRELITSRLSKQVAHESMVTGRRYSGEQAAAAAIVDQALPESEVLTAALALANSLAAKAGPTIAKIRSDMYSVALEALDQDAGS